MGEHWDAAEASCLTPQQELDTIEIGDRADWWAVMLDLARAYNTQESRERACVTTLVAQVAEGTSWQGLPYPAEWLADGMAAVQSQPEGRSDGE